MIYTSDMGVILPLTTINFRRSPPLIFLATASRRRERGGVARIGRPANYDKWSPMNSRGELFFGPVDGRFCGPVQRWKQHELSENWCWEFADVHLGETLPVKSSIRQFSNQNWSRYKLFWIELRFNDVLVYIL